MSAAGAVPAKFQANKLHALTGIRFFAAMHVVIFHARHVFVFMPLWFRHIINTGDVAVSFFFILSGFVLSYTYLQPGGEFRGTRREFWAARLARIYPVYLLAFLMFFPRLFIGEPILVGQRLSSGLLTVSLLQ